MAVIGDRHREIERLLAERNRTERELRRVNRALRVRSECNQAIVRAEAEPALLQAVCRILVEPGGYRMAWVGYAEADGQRRVWPMAMAGHETAYVERIKITWADDEHGQGPGGKALRTGVPQVNRDFRSNAYMTPWRVDALA
ncbi:MAG TPA: GAF domain-containing protein, partial [Usitatibacteraceae bacterium]|nr:GAF domain-containing protein [Usitatibacteraceae bacterium]